jgi:hypothetical protein
MKTGEFICGLGCVFISILVLVVYVVCGLNNAQYTLAGFFSGILFAAGVNILIYSIWN